MVEMNRSLLLGTATVPSSGLTPMSALRPSGGSGTSSFSGSNTLKGLDMTHWLYAAN